MNRDTKDAYFMDLATVASRQSKCLKAHVGAVIIDAQDHVKAIGYNGVPGGFPHCAVCRRNRATSPTGEVPECPSVHADQNALLQLDNKFTAVAMYTTLYPCLHCAKLIAQTSIKEVLYIIVSSSGDRYREDIEAVFTAAGIKSIRLEIGPGGRWTRC